MDYSKLDRKQSGGMGFICAILGIGFFEGVCRGGHAVGATTQQGFGGLLRKPLGIGANAFGQRLFRLFGLLLLHQETFCFSDILGHLLGRQEGWQ